MIARNRFVNLSGETALKALELQSNLTVDALHTVLNFPWVYTNAGYLAEAAAHWAFTLHPELRVDDNFWS